MNLPAKSLTSKPFRFLFHSFHVTSMKDDDQAIGDKSRKKNRVAFLYPSIKSEMDEVLMARHQDTGQSFVPPNRAHGYIALSITTVISYYDFATRT